MKKYENLDRIDSWINDNEEFIRHWAFHNNFKIWKEAKKPFHLGIQKKTPTKSKTFFDYGPIQKIKITFQNQIYLKPYMENCDFLWWVQGNKVKVVDMMKLYESSEIDDGIGTVTMALKDGFGNRIFTPEQVSGAIIQLLDTSEKINFVHKKSFDKYQLSYFREKTHKEAWIITITHDNDGFHASVIDWASYSRKHNVKNIQLKRNGETFIKASRGEISKKAHFKHANEFSFYTEDANMKIPAWLLSYLKQSSIIDLLYSVFSIQADSACNYVNNSSYINRYIDNKVDTYLQSYKQSACIENNDKINQGIPPENCLEVNNEALKETAGA
jgi:hypothetical protein